MKKPFSNFYKGKKVFITGHTGFKGAWLTLWLIELGAKVAGYALDPPTKPSVFETLKLKKYVVDIRGDIRDRKKLKAALKKHKPEIIFHLAAQPLVRRSYREPGLTYETNVIGTVNLLEAARETQSVRAIVIVTTDKCYENQEWVFGYRENDHLGGHDPYSSSKACSELVTAAYRNSFFNPKEYGKKHRVVVSSARAGNVIGGGDWAEDRLVPDCIRFLIANKTIILRNPHATRPWQFVLDPLSGYLLLAYRMWTYGTDYGEAWNFGPYDEDILSVNKVVETVIKTWGNGKVKVNKSALHEAKLLKLDISKSRFNLKWKPTYTAEEAIKNTVDWYKKFYDGNVDMRKFTKNQIKEYTEKSVILTLK